jgi:hypothetical protein
MKQDMGKKSSCCPAIMVTAITKWRGSGLLAHAETGFLRCMELNFQAPEGHALDSFVFSIAKGLLFTQSAGTP